MVFNRFARQARSCVEAAVEEARDLGHDSVGDEDLLLGILDSDEGVAREALVSLGVTAEAVRHKSEEFLASALASIGVSLEETRRSAGEAFDMRLPKERRIPFSPRAKKALEQSLREAIRLEENRITAEHVLLGILREPRGTAVRIIAELGVQAADVEQRLEQLRRTATTR